MKAAARVYCDSGKNPMSMYYIMPPEVRKGPTGLLVFLSVYGDYKNRKAIRTLK